MPNIVEPGRTILSRRRLAGVVALVVVVASALACGASAQDTGATAPAGPTARPAVASAIPVSAPVPEAASTAFDELVFVSPEEPESLSAWRGGCGGSVSNAICGEIVSDPLTWIDSATFEVVPLAGVVNWSQQDPHRWRFVLREGVSFHNGEPWNAEAAKVGLDYLGDKSAATDGHGGRSFGLHGEISGRVVDDYVVDVVCELACPIFPRTAIFSTFQAPDWWDNATEDEQAETTVGFGPYRIAGHVAGEEVQLEAFESYRGNSAFDAQSPTIKSARQVWRSEPLARVAMIRSGEAHWGADIGFENIRAVPVAKSGASNEVFTLVADNIWHQELSKKEVRIALAHAVDCQFLVEILYGGFPKCIGNISQWGTVGIHESNFSPYEFNPQMSRQLLASAGYYHADYNPENNNYHVNPEIKIHTRPDRVYRGLELLESVTVGWRELGVNAELVVLDPFTARQMRLSGCGALDGPELQLDCVNQAPPGVGHSTHYYETVTSNETLDMQRQLLLRTSCHNANSRVCNLAPGRDGMTFQESIADAIATPMGSNRQRKMEELAQLIHDEYWFLPFFVSTQVYGLAPTLEWKPRYDARIRLNSMRFTGQ